MKRIAGFTIIELVVVITILGVLAAVALPKFFDVRGDARNAAAQGVAGGIASAAALNYGLRLARGSATTGGTGPVFTVNACSTAVLGLLLTNGMPTGYTVANGATSTFASTGAANDCVIIAPGTVSGTANNGSATANVVAVVN